MLNLSNHGVICICTPHHTHRDIDLETYKHGKHILCETY
ncbi:Gfo/Idh/MocA family oxidoreductase [Candidatus Bathyarchaeota archaeon]|nr:Gfo/Idh/MocA family oxidoreductase [Candidatus Bathyarchaeota archaeon]